MVHHPADDLGSPHVDGPVDLDDAFPGVVPEHGGDVVDVDAGLGQRLARVERLRARDLLAVALEQVGDAVQEGGAFGDRRPRPGPFVEGGAGGEDRGLRVLGRGLVDDLEHLGVEGVHHVAGAAGRGGAPPAGDEQFGHVDS